MPWLWPLAQGVFDVSSHREIRDNANTICVIAADDAAKEDLEGRPVAEREDDAKGLTQELHGLRKSIACGACRRAE
jgi:hypothetical protein